MNNRNWIFVTLSLAVFPFSEVSALKCYHCFSNDECTAHDAPLVECDQAYVLEASNHFQFLPNVRNQKPSSEYYCAGYHGVVNNNITVALRGCFYSTYNPCTYYAKAEENKNVDYRCKYCNLSDGCNSSSQLPLLPLRIYVGVAFVTLFAMSMCK